MFTIISFRRLHYPPIILADGRKTWYWEIAESEKDLHRKLNGDMAEVIMPAKNIFVRFWRKFCPLKGIECRIDETAEAR